MGQRAEIPAARMVGGGFAAVRVRARHGLARIGRSAAKVLRVAASAACAVGVITAIALGNSSSRSRTSVDTDKLMRSLEAQQRELWQLQQNLAAQQQLDQILRDQESFARMQRLIQNDLQNDLRRYQLPR